jgi:hypothetical protein
MTKLGLLSLCLAMERIERASQQQSEDRSEPHPVMGQRLRRPIPNRPRKPIQIEIAFDDRQFELNFGEIA